jgi:uncharacterized protein (TIRG00374 family)
LRRANLILLAVALVFIFWLLQKVGWQTIGEYLRRVGWYWPLLLLPFGLVNLLEAVSWKYLLLTGETRPSVWRLFWLRLGGEALNQLTPTACLGGEPFKASGLHSSGVSWGEAAASVVIHKSILVLSLALYIFLGLGLAPFLLPGAKGHLTLLTLAALGLALVGGGFIYVQRRAPCSTGFRLLNRLGWCPSAVKNKEESFNNLDAHLAGFYREHPGRCLLAFTLFFLSWVLHGVEVYLMFWLLGHPIGWDLAICLDALAMLFAAMGFFIPASMGVQEGGNILLSMGFDLGMVLGVAFSILRRLREAFWLALGLLVVAREK